MEQAEHVKALQAAYRPDDIVKLSDDGNHHELTLDLSQAVDIPHDLKN
jgi:hypothetical protein